MIRKDVCEAFTGLIKDRGRGNEIEQSAGQALRIGLVQ